MDRIRGQGRGIWAVDPTQPDDPNSQIQLSTELGTPLAWSSDGSKLLILRGNTHPPPPPQFSPAPTCSCCTRTARRRA